MIVSDPVVIFTQPLFPADVGWNGYRILIVHPINGNPQVNGIKAGFIGLPAPVMDDSSCRQIHRVAVFRFGIW
jgi:hypothetical protein